MMKVGISGANGTMGRLTIEAINGVDDLTVGGLYAPGHGSQEILGHKASDNPAALADCDVILEVTNPTALMPQSTLMTSEAPRSRSCRGSWPRLRSRAPCRSSGAP